MSLYSAFIIDAETPQPDLLSLFTYQQSQPVAGSSGISATAAHTNVPRSSWNGLPVNWDMFVRSWRAQTNLRIDEPLMDWAAETSVQLDYNSKAERMMPLLDLLMAPQTFDEAAYPGAPTGLWIRENLTFEVRILMQPKATQMLQDFLISHTRGHRLICWIYLEGQLRKNVQ